MNGSFYNMQKNRTDKQSPVHLKSTGDPSSPDDVQLSVWAKSNPYICVRD